MIKPAFLHEGDKEGTGLGKNPDVRGVAENGPGIALLLIVADVPMTPTDLVRGSATALLEPASITSRTGTGDRAVTASPATAAIVLQAIISSLTSCRKRNSAI